MKKINYSEPTITNNTFKYLAEVLQGKSLESEKYSDLSTVALKKLVGCNEVLLTNSCTAALEMIAILLDLKQGDEVIMPSYTFVTTASAFVKQGAVPVFVDICPKTLTIDIDRIEEAITPKTKSIIAVHYAGVACAMNEIMELAAKHNLYVVEDAAQGINADYKGAPLGSIGHLAAMSFHPTKNITAGLAGALLINDESFIARAKVIWQKGTNRDEFLKGKVDKYTWVDLGSSYSPSELTAAMLYAQLESLEFLTQKRKKVWNQYYTAFQDLAERGVIQFPSIPEYSNHNAHIFYLLLKSKTDRDALITHLSQNNIEACFHYIPLHSAPAGKKWARFEEGDLKHTEDLYKRIVRLPLHSSLNDDEVQYTIEKTKEFLLKL